MSGTLPSTDHKNHSGIHSGEHAESGLLRFGLPVLFYITAVIAAAIALMGTGGLIWAGVVFLFWGSVILDKRKKRRLQKEVQSPARGRAGYTLVELVVVIAIIGLLVGMLLPGVGRYSRSAAMRVTNMNSMRQLVLAMHNYESEHGHLPPAYVADESGNPMHSWRVLLLPYLDHQSVYDRYDFDEPWDGPSNRKLVSEIDRSSPLFSVGKIRAAKEFETCFKLVTGAGSAFEHDKTIGFEGITAGSSQTFAMLEDTVHPVCWMAPEDVSIDQAVVLFDREKSPDTMARSKEQTFSTITYFGSSIGCFDGSTHYVGGLKNPEQIREHFTIATPPETSFEDLEFMYENNEVEKKPRAYALLGINVLLVFLPSFWFLRRKWQPRGIVEP